MTWVKVGDALMDHNGVKIELKSWIPGGDLYIPADNIDQLMSGLTICLNWIRRGFVGHGGMANMSKSGKTIKITPLDERRLLIIPRVTFEHLIMGKVKSVPIFMNEVPKSKPGTLSPIDEGLNHSFFD